MSRDKLQALLWPESDTTHARRTLNQLLYAQRRTVGTAEIFVGKKNLRLNTEVVSTDIAEFEDAVESGELQRAVGLYRGPFLDGFFLGGSQEFERWVDDQRRRLARVRAAAIASLAQQATASGQLAVAVEWWNRAVEHDPLDGRAVASLVESLTRTGDVAGAQRATREYEDRLKNP